MAVWTHSFTTKTEWSWLYNVVVCTDNGGRCLWLQYRLWPCNPKLSMQLLHTVAAGILGWTSRIKLHRLASNSVLFVKYRDAMHLGATQQSPTQMLEWRLEGVSLVFSGCEVSCHQVTLIDRFVCEKNCNISPSTQWDRLHWRAAERGVELDVSM